MTEAELTKARLTNDIRPFLKKFFLFRAQVTFKNHKKIHLYGHEHQCTYSQVLHTKVESIKLDAEKGYTDLIKYIEAKAKTGNVRSAKIYGRTQPGDPFNCLHRSWFNSEWEEINDPEIFTTPDQCIRNLQYQIINNNIIIKNTNQTPLEQLLKDEVTAALNK